MAEVVPDPVIRTVVTLNAQPDCLGWVASQLGRAGRCIHLREHGATQLSVAVAGGDGAGAGFATLLPLAVAFGPAAYPAALFATMQAPRLLVVHDAVSAGRLETLLGLPLWDALCLGPAVAVDPPAGLAALADQPMPALRGARVLARPEAAPGLFAALFRLDGDHRRRRAQGPARHGVAELALCRGFQPMETDGRGDWAWTGPDTVATVLMPGHGAGRFLVGIGFRAATIPLDADTLRIRVHGAAADCTYHQDTLRVALTVAMPDLPAVRLDLLQQRPPGDPRRARGLALRDITIEAVR